MTPVKIERDDFGLVKGINYIFKDDGRRVDWRAMIPSEYLVPNRQNFERRGEKVPESIEGVADKDLLILLDGIKYVADLRGYLFSFAKHIDSSPLHCTVAWEIQWIPNFETEGLEKVSGGVGDANHENTTGFGRKFLGPIAENRAFVRNVRNFLRIQILGKDEVDGAPISQEETKPTSTSSDISKLRNELTKLMKVKKVSFEMIKEKLIAEGVSGANEFESIDSFPTPILFTMIERLQKKKTPEKKVSVT